MNRVLRCWIDLLSCFLRLIDLKNSIVEPSPGAAS
jgi:hypothetical protein